jgi:hypothetical protein
MTELPEKKVLKDLLIKLKARTLSSEESFQKTQADSFTSLKDILLKLIELNKDATGRDKEIAKGFLTLVSLIGSDFKGISESAQRYHQDLKLYLETLEQYSTDLDKTLSQIFEEARKQGEEQIKEQEELRKRTSPDFYTA